jgi:hypothetical protein
MKQLIGILTILTLTTLTVSGQVKKCDGTILLSTSEKIGKLNAKEIVDFLLTFGQVCRDNAEYSEWSNELLFKLLDNQTELALKTMEKEEKRLEMGTILDDLSEPIGDASNIENLIVKIEKVDFSDRLKWEIIKNLKTADEKY